MKNCVLFFILFFQAANLIAQKEVAIIFPMFPKSENQFNLYSGKKYNPLEIKWMYKTDGKVFSSPFVFNNTVFIGSADKNLYAIDEKTGSLKWKFTTSGAVHSSPVVFKDVVYFGSFDGYYYAVDINTGREKWKFKTGGEKWIGGKGYWGMKPDSIYMEDPWDYFLSSPAIDTQDVNPIVYFGSSDGNLYAVRAGDGGLIWKFQTNGIIHTSPTLCNGIVYIGSWDTYLYAIDAKKGVEKWKFKTGDRLPMSGIQASAIIYNGTVYFGARDANLYALNARTGELIWKYFADNSWIISTAAIKDGMLYVGTSDSFLFLAIDTKTGKEKFRFKTNGYVYSSPFIVDNTAYFGDFTGKLYALDLASAGKKWSEFSTENRKRNAGAVLNKDTLDFQYAANGKDLSFYASNMEVMNNFYTLGPIVSSPVVKDGCIFFGGADGYIYALRVQTINNSQE